MDRSLQLVVKKIEPLTSSIKKFILTSDSILLPPFGAGAHITLHLPMGRRQYSLVNNPLNMDNEYVIAVKKIDGEISGSTYLHERVKIGDILTTSTPDNFFPVRTEAKHHVLFAAGIGITPFISMMKYLKAIGHTFELHYSAPAPKESAFYPELLEQFQKESVFYFMKRDEKVSRLKEALRNRKVGTHIYVCGPKSFMEMIIDFALDLGYPKTILHEERFEPASKIENPQPFKTTLVKTNKEFEVKADQTLLEALLEQNVKVPYNCRMGVCGSCEVPVAGGEILHCESFLTEDEKKQSMLSCASRGINHIKLDL